MKLVNKSQCVTRDTGEGEIYEKKIPPIYRESQKSITIPININALSVISKVVTGVVTLQWGIS